MTFFVDGYMPLQELFACRYGKLEPTLEPVSEEVSTPQIPTNRKIAVLLHVEVVRAHMYERTGVALVV